jgi:hypothetical protein
MYVCACVCMYVLCDCILRYEGVGGPHLFAEILYVCMYVCMYICLRKYYMYVCMCLCMYTCVCVCMSDVIAYCATRE